MYAYPMSHGQRVMVALREKALAMCQTGGRLVSQGAYRLHPELLEVTDGKRQQLDVAVRKVKFEMEPQKWVRFK